MASDGIGSRLRGVAAALLNATLLLAALVLALAVALAVQVRGVVTDGREELRAEIVDLRAQLAQTRSELEQRVTQAPAPGAIPRPGIDPDLQAFAQSADALMSRLETMEGTEEDALARGFFAAFFRFVLGRILAAESQG
jgi:uncharacterized protein HemX